MKKVNRREFGKRAISAAASLGAGLAFPSLLRSGGASAPGGVVVWARSDGLKRIGHDVNREHAAKILTEALKRITRTSSGPAAWGSLFSPRERVGIKLSCLPGKPLSSSRGMVEAIVEGLLSAGVKAENIWVWERTRRELERAGFDRGFRGVRILGTDSLPGGGYSGNIEMSGSVGTCFSRIVEYVDAMISVPVLKDHDIAGVSIGMKNFFGAIYNPNKFHADRCDPYVADLYNHPLIKNKCRLTVCDASRVQVHNGPAFYPQYAWEYGGLLVGLDPVALDYVGWQIIEEGRKELKLKSLKEAGKEPTYIETAAKLGLGKMGMNAVKRIKL